MQVGLPVLGIGAGAQRAVIDAVAAAAEACGFATLWSGEHVVMVDKSSSRYPYADDRQIAVAPTADWLDPMIGLSFAAAATSTIGIATGVLLLPEHNPVVIAKQAATLDMLSGGRLTLGVGVGWSREEFDALGVPFEPAARCREGAPGLAWGRQATHLSTFTPKAEYAVRPMHSRATAASFSRTALFIGDVCPTQADRQGLAVQFEWRPGGGPR